MSEGLGIETTKTAKEAQLEGAREAVTEGGFA